MTDVTVTVLDHGYLRPVESYGSDERIIEAARMSTAKGFLGWGPKCINATCPGTPTYASGDHPRVLRCPSCACTMFDSDAKPGDEKLLRYLWEHKHATPFEMAGAIIEVQAPIFVFREWHRHRTQSYNEMSARYTPLPDLNYVPTVERLMLGGGHLTKQAGTIAGADVLTRETAVLERADLVYDYERAEESYQRALKRGVPKELARLRLPVGRYSRMRAHANLRNWLAFLTLRMDKTAQWEIRQYANAMHELLSPLFPRTLALFDEGANG